MTWLDNRINELYEKKRTVGLTEEEAQDLCELEGRLISIEAERNYLNGEV